MGWDYKAMLEHGSRLYPYIISYAGYEYAVYPSTCFDEVKRLSPAKASTLVVNCGRPSMFNWLATG